MKMDSKSFTPESRIAVLFYSVFKSLYKMHTLAEGKTKDNQPKQKEKQKKKKKHPSALKPGRAIKVL